MDFITRHKALLLFGLFMGALAGLSIPSLMNAGGVEIADWVFITGALSGGALGLGLATAYAKAKDARQIVPVYPPPPLIIQVVPAAGQKEGTPNPGLQMPTPISLPSLVGSLSASDLSYSSKRPEGQPPPICG